MKMADREIISAYHIVQAITEKQKKATEVSVETTVLTNPNTYHIHSHRFQTGLEGLREPVVVKKPQELQLRKQALYMLRACENESETEAEENKRGVRKCEER